jgi:hypothetical protein
MIALNHTSNKRKKYCLCRKLNYFNRKKIQVHPTSFPLNALYAKQKQSSNVFMSKNESNLYTDIQLKFILKAVPLMSSVLLFRVNNSSHIYLYGSMKFMGVKCDSFEFLFLNRLQGHVGY